MRTLMIFGAAMLALGCGEKDKADDTGKPPDTSPDQPDDSQPGPDDTNNPEPTDDGRLRPGAWLLTVTGVIENTCQGVLIAEGEVYQLTIHRNEDDTHRFGDVLPIMYNEDGGFSVNGVELRQRSDGDCMTENTIRSSGTYSDWQHITQYGRDENFVSTGTQCEGWARNNGEPCSIEVVYSGEWVGENFPE